MRVAIAHDYFYTLGGAEQTVAVMRGLWPQAPVYTSFVDRSVFPLDTVDGNLRTSFLQRIPQPARLQKLLTPLYPLAFRSFNLEPFDVVVSSASFAAKGLPRRKDTLHICYCYTPPRFLWGMTPATDRMQMTWPLRGLDALLRPHLRRWDRWAAAQPHHMVAISHTVAERIRRTYDREATVIYPPVATDRFQSQPARDEGYYVYVGRLESHKRVDIAIAAAQDAGVHLRVIGDGPLRNRLAESAPANVTLLGWTAEKVLIAQLAGCSALLFPGEEDFGIVMVEALSAGKPVIAYGAGGATEIVQPGVNGMLVTEQSVAAFSRALREFTPGDFSPDVCRKTAAQFDQAVFAAQFKDFVEAKWTEFTQTKAIS